MRSHKTCFSPNFSQLANSSFLSSMAWMLSPSLKFNPNPIAQIITAWRQWQVMQTQSIRLKVWDPNPGKKANFPCNCNSYIIRLLWEPFLPYLLRSLHLRISFWFWKKLMLNHSSRTNCFTILKKKKKIQTFSEYYYHSFSYK